MDSSKQIAPDRFQDKEVDDTHDGHLEQAFSDEGISDGATQELDNWGGPPRTDEEVGDDSSEKEDITPKDTMDPASNKIMDEGKGATMIEDLNDITSGTEQNPSALGVLHTPDAGSPTGDLVEKCVATTSDSEQANEQHTFNETDAIDQLIPQPSFLAKEGADQINSPMMSVGENTPPAPEALDTFTSTSTALTTETIDSRLAPDAPVEHASDENPMSMAEAKWLQKLRDTGPNYDGEWDDSPSRGSSMNQNQVSQYNSLDKPFPAAKNTQEHQLFSILAASDDPYAAPAFNTTEGSLIDGLEDVDLNSPAKKLTKKSSNSGLVAKHSDAEDSQPYEADSTDGLIEATLGQHQLTDLRLSLTPKTPNSNDLGNKKISGAANIGSRPKLHTPAGVSPLPSFSKIRLQADHNSKYGNGKSRKTLRKSAPTKTPDVDVTNLSFSPLPNTKALIDSEYADVSIDTLDYEMGNYGSKDYPTYHFPGTYDAAKHDTYIAAKNVSSAAMSFGNAMAVSGVGKALWSVGTVTAKGARRAGTVIGTQATMSAIKLGYKDSLPEFVAQWAEAKSQEEERKAEKKKPNYKLAEPRYTKVDPVNYVLEPYPSSVKENMIDLDEDLDDEDWTMVNVKGNADQKAPRSTARVHGEAPPTDHEDDPPFTPYEAFMTATESTAMAAANLGRMVRSQAVALVDQQRQRQIQKQRDEHWPKDARELVQANKYERVQTIARIQNPHFTKVRNAHGELEYPDKPGPHETDDVPDNFDDMALSDGEV